MRKILMCLIMLTSWSLPAAAAEKGVADKGAKSNFDRTHDVIDRRMGTGNDRSPPLGQGRGEQTGIGGAHGGGNQPGGANQEAINQRNQ